MMIYKVVDCCNFISSIIPGVLILNLKPLCTMSTAETSLVSIQIFIVFCVGRSKAPPVLYSSYRTHNVWTDAVTSYSV